MPKLVNALGFCVSIDGEEVNALWIEQADGREMAFVYVANGTAQGERRRVLPDALIAEHDGETHIQAFTQPRELVRARLAFLKDHFRAAAEEGRGIRLHLGPGECAALLVQLERAEAAGELGGGGDA